MTPEIQRGAAVGSSVLLGIRFIIFFPASFIPNYRHQNNACNHKPGGNTLPKCAVMAVEKAKRCPNANRNPCQQSGKGESQIK